MEQTASPVFNAHALADQYVARFTQFAEFVPGERHFPIGIFCRPTARDVLTVLKAWLFGIGVPRRA